MNRRNREQSYKKGKGEYLENSMIVKTVYLKREK